jgi:hypothetical protein
MLSICWWSKKIRKTGYHDQNHVEPNRYMSFRNKRDHQNTFRVLSLAGEVAGLLHLWWPWALEADHGPSPAGGFVFFV